MPGIRSSQSGRESAAAADTATMKDFAGEIAHELNNILTAIGGNLSLLSESAERQKIDADAEALLDAAIRSLEHGASLSEKLEAFAGRLRLHRTAVNVNRIVDETLDWLADSALQSVEIHRVLSSRSPMAFVDGERLRTAIVGSAMAAWRAMAETGHRLVISTESVVIAAEGRLKLRPGSYARISLGFVARANAMQEIAGALVTLRAGGRADRHRDWSLASIAGFAAQSAGHLAASRRDGQKVYIDLYLPSEKIPG